MDLLKELEMDNKETKMDLTGLSLEELNKVIFDANKLIRRKQFEAREQRKTIAKTELSVGDIVSVASDKFKGEVWEVLKLNPKKVKCRRDNGEVWNIAYSSIKILD